MTPCQRILLESAAELDPDTYVPVLDLLDTDACDLEDDEREPEPVDCWFEPEHQWVPVYDQCPCCGTRTREGWTQ